jgi:hypothetical protein
MPAFPTFAAGNSVWRPFTVRRTYKNAAADNAVGHRYAYNERAMPLMEWACEGAVVSDEDLAELNAFWASVHGAFEDFSFVDPDTGVTHAKCRFVGNELVVQHRGPNEHAVSFTVRQLV